MDWDRVIERNRAALKCVLAALVAMAGLTISQSPPLRGRCPAGQRGVGPEGAADVARPTLPRHLHRAVLRLLRPAEAAARRLVIVFALAATPQARKTGDVVKLPPARPRKTGPDPKAAHAALRGLGIAIVTPHNLPHPEARGDPELRACRGVEGKPRRTLCLPLSDPIRLPRPGRPRYVPAHAAPRILSFGDATPHRLPPPPSPDDPIDAARLGLRLAAVISALDDLPKHARRFARWKAARDAAGAQNRESDAAGAQNRETDAAGARNTGTPERGRVRRLSPLRPGRPPGLSAANRRRPAHEVHEVLADLHCFALEALQPNDTS